MALLGQKIKDLRNSYHLTQTELAVKIGVTKSTVAAYENDSRQPSYDVLIKLAKTFHVTTDTLLLDTKQSALDVDGLTKDQIQTLETLIESFHTTNFLNQMVEMKSTALLDLILKYREAVENEKENAEQVAKQIIKAVSY